VIDGGWHQTHAAVDDVWSLRAVTRSSDRGHAVLLGGGDPGRFALGHPNPVLPVGSDRLRSNSISFFMVTGTGTLYGLPQFGALRVVLST